MRTWATSPPSRTSGACTSRCRPASRDMTMRLILTAAAVSLSLSGAALAQSAPPGEQPVDPYVQSNANAGATPMKDASVLEAFHGKAGLARITGDLVDRNIADPRIKDIFATADVTRLKRTLAEQF